MWAQKLTAQLGNARLLTYRATGMASLTDLNPCVIGTAFAYLEQGVLPAEGTVCQQDAPFEPLPAAAASRQSGPAGRVPWDTGARLR